MIRNLLLLSVSVVAAVGVAAPANADQYDYVSALDSRGIYYDSISDIIDIGKLTCGRMRRGMPITGPQGVGAPITALGYSGLEAAIITVEAARNMCPDQLPQLESIAATNTGQGEF